MIPESEYIEKSIVIRDMRLPQEVMLTKASLVRWLALSLGLINPNESRKSVIDIIEVLFDNYFKGKGFVSVDEIMEKLRARNVNISEKTVRYHLLRMVKRGVVKHKNKMYSIVIPDTDEDCIDALIKSYDEGYRNAMKKIRIALGKLRNMY